MQAGNPVLTSATGASVRSTRMGISDNLGDLARKVQQVAREHPEQTEQALDKLEHIIDEKTGKKYSEQLDKGAEQLKQRLGEHGRPQ